MHDFRTIRRYDETGISHEMSVPPCQPRRMGTSYFTVFPLPHLGRGAKWRRMFGQEGLPPYGAYLLRY